MAQRIYIIGAGVISRQHMSARATWPRETQVYVADPNAAARSAFSAEFPDAHVYPSSEQMLAHAPSEPDDLVVVATPPKYHCTESIQALRSGRNVICEKPFAMDMNEARSMVDEARRLGLYISTCSNRFLRWGGNEKAKALVNEGQVGDPYLVDFQHRESCSRTGVEYQHGSWWFLSRTANGGGPLMDWGPYDFACLLDIFEPIGATITHAHATSIPVRFGLPEDVVFDIDTHTSASIELELQSGRTIMLRYERGTCQHGEELHTEGIYGTTGHLSWHWLPFQDQSRLSIRRTKAPGLADRTVYPVEPYADEEHWMGAPLREMDRFIHGDPGAKALVNGEALRAFSIIQAIYEFQAHRKPIHLDFSKEEYQR